MQGRYDELTGWYDFHARQYSLSRQRSVYRERCAGEMVWGGSEISGNAMGITI